MAVGHGWRRKMVTSAVTLLVLYAAMLVLARVFYRRVLYPAPVGEDEPIPDGATLLTLRASDGVAVHALDFARDAPRTFVLFHGNGERMEWGADFAERLEARGFGVVLAEYRGYGRSRGVEPSEEGLYRDASAVLDALAAAGVGPERIVLWGTSLGTGVAMEMARRGRCARLVLFAPFTSIRAVGARVAPFVPMSVIVPDRFDSLTKAGEIHVPTLIVHGDHDQVVPYDMGQTLANAIPGARFVTVHGGHHMDVFAVDGEHLLREVTDFARR